MTLSRSPLRVLPAIAIGLALAAPAAADCVPDEETLCFLGGRVEVRAEWRNQHAGGVQGVGRAVPLTEQTGAFWFFDPRNLEVMVKVLDGGPVNGRIWVFVGSLSDVEYWVTADDTATGLRRVYYNPPGNVYGIADVGAFDDSGEPEACGGFLGTPCPGEQFCDPIPGACGGADLPGVCVERPTTEICDMILAPSIPVCGCDGMTYGSDCYRLAAGVQKDHDGPCGSEP